MSNSIKIDQRIKSVAVRDANTPEPVAPVVPEPDYVQMNEKIVRPECLQGATYKLKPVSMEHAMYVTINDVVLNPGTAQEHHRPFEIFINSKNMEDFQWVVALTRIMSAVFRKGGDVTFVVEEMKAVFDPKGGYWKPGTGVFVPSVVAEIGMVIEQHLVSIGMLQKPQMSEAQQAHVAEKRQAAGVPVATGLAPGSEAGYPASATSCAKCHQKAVVVLDGCATCLSCGWSKCG